MKLFNAKFLLYLTNKSAQFISNINSEPLTFEYPQESVVYGEVANAELFQESFEDFLKQHPFSSKVFILLAPELVFYESIDQVTDDKQIDDFFDLVPIPPNSLAKFIAHGKPTKLYAANTALYSLVVEILRKNKVEVGGVFPLIAFTDKRLESVSSEDAKQILEKLPSLQKYNLLKGVVRQSNDSESDTEATEKPNNKKQYLVLSITLLFFIIALVYALLNFNVIKNPFFSKKSLSQNKIPVPTVTNSTISPHPTNAVVNKGQLKIQILNGSGIEGQANKTKLLLQSNGYTQIETGNSTTATDKSVVEYDSSINRQQADDIIRLLHELYPSVSSKEAKLDTFNIIITTGKEK